MKAKSRRRLLISSIAMLLVAMLALGTATFAWFTSSTTVTADKIKVHTTKASKLQVSSATSDWQNNLEYNYDQLLLPTSTINGSNWWRADATNSSSFAATEYQAATNSPDGTKYYIADQLNVKNNADPATGVAVDDVQIKMTWPTSGDTSYLRVALVEATDKGENKSLASGANFTDGIYAKDTTGYKPINADGEENESEIAPKAGGSNTVVVSVGTLAPGAAKYYNLYVWFEGQDTDCYDANAGAEIPDIDFEVTGNNASQV